MSIALRFIMIMLFLSTPLSSFAETQKELESKIISLVQDSKYEEALVLTDKYIEQYPNDAFGYGEKGSALSAMNRQDEAIEYYKKAVESSDAIKTIWFGNIARAYKKMNKFDDAIEYFRKAIEEDKRMFSDNMFPIADIYLLQGERAEAYFTFDDAKKKIEESEKALVEMSEINKGNVYGRAAWVAYQLDRQTEALEYAEKYKDLKGTDRARLGFAIYLARYGYIDRAKNEFASVNKGNCSPLSLSLFFLLLNDNENAASYFNKSYEEQKSPAQLKSWRHDFKQDAMCQNDDWKKARIQDWFRNKAQE